MCFFPSGERYGDDFPCVGGLYKGNYLIIQPMHCVFLPVSTDEAELALKKNGIRGFAVLRWQMNLAFDRIKEDAPDTPVPVPGGLHFEEVCSILDALGGKLAGLGIYEYAPSGLKNTYIDKLIRFGLDNMR